MRTRVWTGLLVFALLMAFAASAGALQLTGWKQDVYNLIMDNKFPEAEKALAAHPEAVEDIEFLFLRGKLYRFIGRLAEAKTDLDKALKKNKNFAEAHAELALVYGWLGDFTNGLSQAEEALRLNATAEHYYTRGRIHTAATRLDQALADINKAIAMEPNNSEYYVGRGVVYRLQNKIKEAKAEFDKAISLDKENFRAFLERSAIFVIYGDPIGAREDINHAIQLCPTYFGGYLRRGYIYTNRGDAGQALEDFTQAIKLAPQIVEGYVAKADLLWRMGRATEAEKVAREGLKIKADEPQLWILLHYTLAAQEKWAESLDAINRFIALAPSAWEGYNMRGQLFYVQKKYPEALAEFDLALKKNPKRLEPKVNKIQILMEQKKTADALKLANEILAEDSENIIALQIRMSIYEILGRNEEALRDLEKIEQVRKKLMQQQQQH